MLYAYDLKTMSPKLKKKKISISINQINFYKFIFIINS